MFDDKTKLKIFFLRVIKTLSALAVAYVIALIGQELIKYGIFSFVFVMISVTISFLYLVKSSGFLVTLSIDVFLIVLAFLLRLYILWAYHS